MGTFIRHGDGKYAASGGNNDDLVLMMANLFYAWYGSNEAGESREDSPNPILNYTPDVPHEIAYPLIPAQGRFDFRL